MKKLFLVLILLTAGTVGFGTYRGWFQFSSERLDQESKVTLTVAWDKIQQDKEKASARIHGLGGNAKDTSATENAQPQPQPQP
jgi:uncharacterized alpha/beta hydrolase family protein